MSTRILAALMAALCGLSGCAGHHANATRTPTTVAGGGPTRTTALNGRWFRSVLTAQGTTVTGSALMKPGHGKGTTEVQLELVGGMANAVYPWDIRIGLCGTDGQLLAGSEEYTPLEVAENGAGRTTATLNVPPPSGGNYHIHVYASASDAATVVSCGNLEQAGV